MQLSNEELKESLLKQLRLFLKCCELTKSPVHHIKPHGALYNDLFHDAAKVEVFVAVIKTLLPQAKLYCSPGSLLEKEALRSGIQVKREGFMDRTYNEDGTLRSRLLAGAVLTDLDEVGSQVLSIVKDQAVTCFWRRIHSIIGSNLMLAWRSSAGGGVNSNCKPTLKIKWNRCTLSRILILLLWAEP